jgi:predicted DNA-binding transcriptional regulator YafY
MARPGRDQTAPMERLVRVIGVLNQHPDGAPTALLLQAVAPDTGDDDARRKMLSRDLDGLNALGYDIRNVADPGAEGVYVMRAHDNRLQVHLSPEQRGELLRAAILAGLEGMETHLGSASTTGTAAPPAPADLDLVQRATARRCLVRFGYKGEPRLVHPARVHSGPSGWYLSGREDGGDVVKEFVVSRMSDVTLEGPGTAETVDEPARPALDPLRWEVDPPTDVVLELPAEHRVLVENLLGTPVAAEPVDAALRLRYVVTNRAVFRTRIYELGTRVHIVSPDEVRAELVAELESFVGSDR